MSEERRDTFTVPNGYTAERDAEGRATGFIVRRFDGKRIHHSELPKGRMPKDVALDNVHAAATQMCRYLEVTIKHDLVIDIQYEYSGATGYGVQPIIKVYDKATGLTKEIKGAYKP